jgi:hypothetical protein
MEKRFERTRKVEVPLTYQPFKDLAKRIATVACQTEIQFTAIATSEHPPIELCLVAGQVVLRHEFEAMRDGHHDRIDFRRY